MLSIKSIKSSITKTKIPQINATFEYNSCTTKRSLTMPLVVPGINSGGDNKTDEWRKKLVGKKIGDGPSDATVNSSSSQQCRRTVIPLTPFRLLQGQIYQRRLASSRQARWLRRTSSRTGEQLSNPNSEALMVGIDADFM